MTPDQFKTARLEAGLSVTEMAKLLNLREPYSNGADHVREYESGKRPISGPVVRIVQFLIAGYLGDPFTAMDLTTEGELQCLISNSLPALPISTPKPTTAARARAST